MEVHKVSFFVAMLVGTALGFTNRLIHDLDGVWQPGINFVLLSWALKQIQMIPDLCYHFFSKIIVMQSSGISKKTAQLIYGSPP